MKTLIIALLVLLTAPANAAVLVGFGAGGGGGGSLLVDESFDGTGIPSNGTGYSWAEGGDGAYRPDWDYATSPAPLTSGHSVKIGNNGVYFTLSFSTSMSDVYVAFKYRTTETGHNTVILVDGSNNESRVATSGGDEWVADSYGGSDTYGGTSAADTTYYVKVRQNGQVLTVWTSSVGTSGNWTQVAQSTGTGLGNIASIKFGEHYSLVDLYEDMKVSTSDINW